MGGGSGGERDCVCRINSNSTRTVYEEATGNSIVCCLNARQHASTTSKCNAMQRWVFYMTLQKTKWENSSKQYG